MWQVMLCGHPDHKDDRIVTVDDRPAAVVRRDRRQLEDGRVVEDTYVVNHVDEVLQRALADFMAVDVVEGGGVGVGAMSDPAGVKIIGSV